jgi:hypothetical protein
MSTGRRYLDMAGSVLGSAKQLALSEMNNGLSRIRFVTLG